MLKGKMLSEEALKIAVKRREAKGKGKRKDIPIWMQSSKEQLGEIRISPYLSDKDHWSSVINAKKQRKTIE